ncbi:MAG TPA: hypothetical protein VFK28_03785 [Sphingomicrobium sp.]|jgi:hypothetical protein|nr:hypothetical protein [Sphingomicrobium sp.]
MTTRQQTRVLVARDEIVDAPPARACEDQSFELPGRLYVAMIAMFTGFVAVLAFAFTGGHMGVAYGVIFAFIAAFFAIPAMFTGIAPGDGRSKALSWAMFNYKGVTTATGRTSAKDATVLVLLLPSLIFCFAVAVALIAAFV